ncbi:hypothetical protein [Bythopirellula polymerisocia]|uniref:PEP-CTERM protein-sorting domain-containing protein n=1 Tax=Bythopirellula polymerisocia TaxID=2528003 RepID=A0A5C6D0I8_9BACT|nr:hypothetical protein [Bythopirellula polymerisocia]TWU29675.1 hypothetical protein Pla144_04540 [Bythopirellula polymerisocia]
MMRCFSGTFLPRLGFFLFSLVLLSLVSSTNGQSVFYTFTSGPSGDGFDWPASPQGLLPEGDNFFTPDGVDFYNYTGNNLFFDSQYQVSSNSGIIDGDAMWANPLVGSDFNDLDVFLPDVSSVGFSFAQAVAGSPTATPDFIDIYIEDSEGRYTFQTYGLDSSFTGFGGVDGWAGNILLDIEDLIDDGDIDGNSFIDISYFYIDLDSLATNGGTSEFAIDNFSLDGGSGNGSDLLFPSVNQGQTDVTGSTLGTNTLRGTGTHGMGIEVTNDAGTATTYSIQLVPGGDLSPNTLPSGASIDAGESIFNPDIATVDRSLPSGTYESDITIINDGDPADPDNVATLSIDLFEPELLSGNFTGVNVNAFEDVILSNAAAPANGFRAAVKVTGTQTTGPFGVDDFTLDERVLDSESIQANVTFNRFGQLSGTHVGSYTVSLEQAAFFVNQFVDFEVFLANKEPVPDKNWVLNYDLTNNNNDNANFTTGFTYAGRLGVNRFEVAATLIDGTSSTNQNVSMQFTTDPDPSSADTIGDPIDLIFGGGDGDPYVLQFTYDESLVPSGLSETQLQVLWYDVVAGEWAVAIDGNSSTTSTFFSGSWADYLAGPGGGTFDASDLGAFGVDAANNHVWAALDHASIFAVGMLAAGTNGDFDFDGDVDGRDFLIWQRGGSPNGTGIGDLALWQGQYGSPLVAATVVPEPVGGVMLLTGILLMCRRQSPR